MSEETGFKQPTKTRTKVELATETEHKRMEMGFIGRLWGNSQNAPFNIAGVLLFLLVVIGGVLSVAHHDSVSEIGEIWKVLSPMIGLILGYLFGMSHKTPRDP